MAETAKPHILAVEANYMPINGLTYGNYTFLFDLSTTMSSYNDGYFGIGSHFAEFEVYNDFYFWCITTSYAEHNKSLALYKWDGSSYVNTNKTILREQNYEWYKNDFILTAGRYKVQYYGGLRIDNKWFFEKVNTSYFLISDSNEYKSYNGTNWFVVTTNTPTVSDFTTHGFENTSYVTNYINDNESCDISLLMYNENVIEIAPMNITALPKKQLVQQENEISLHDIINIDNITFASTITNNSYIKCFVSKDQGTTWYTYYNSQWVSYESTIENIETYGMNVQTLQNINTWNIFYDSTYTTLKFVFVLYKDNISDSCNINTLTIQVDLKGKWRGAPNNNTVYVFDYINPTLCKMELYKPGTYKVNY